MWHACGRDTRGRDGRRGWVVLHSHMRRNALIIVAAAVVAWGVLAAALGSPSLRLLSGSGSRGGASPGCLPSTLEHTAALPGTDVHVSPAPETDSASPHTQISFLGVPAAELREVSVAGDRSGPHAGHVAAYSQGDGASFVPDHPFDGGERVAVSAVIGAGAGARRVAFDFRVDMPYRTDQVAQFENPPAAPADVQSFYTLPDVQAPLLTVTVPDDDPAAGDILTTNGPGPGRYGPLIYTPQGRLVWFRQLPGGEAAEDLNEQEYEGRRVLTWWKGRVLSLGFGQGEDLVMNSRYQTVARVAGGNGLKADLHDFRLAPNDIAYITAYNPIRCDLSSVKGSPGGTILDTAIQQIDIRTGLVRWEWHSLDHVGASESEVETAKGSYPWDYFHLNSIDLEPDGNLLIAARSTWAGYQLQGGTGKVLWRLGGSRSSFRMGPGTQVVWEHDGRMLADGQVSFFDDGSSPPLHHQSRGVRIELDFRSHRATLMAAYTHRDPQLLAPSQGNMQTLPDGNVLVGYGGVPAISEFSRAGALLFDAHQPYDMSFYRAFRYPWSGRPATPPAVLASLNDTGEETIVHASWNGATGVSSWRVLAGEQPDALSAQATIPVAGFESSTTLPQKHSYVAVQALDAAGRVLANSKPASVVGYRASLPPERAG
jgi:Arylsulfotransferase (ASST)